MKKVDENKKNKLKLKSASKPNVFFEIRSLDEIREVGNYTWIAEEITDGMGFPDCVKDGDDCHCCEGQLFIMRHGAEKTSQSKDSFGQVLTIINHETGSADIFTRALHPVQNNGNWLPWQMVATGDPELITENNSINETLSTLRRQVENDSRRIETAENSLLASATVRFDRIEENEATINAGEIGSTPSAIVYYKPANKFVAADSAGNYWDTWDGMEAYISGGSVRKDKVFLCKEDTYVWYAESLRRTSFITEVELLSDTKADIVVGRNLFNKQKATLGQGFWSYADDTPLIAPQYSITSYIPVSGNVIMNMETPAGTGHRVYDKDKNIIRRFTTQQYTYQEGEFYVRFTFSTVNIENLQIEVGETSTPHEPYTQHCDIDEEIKNLHTNLGTSPIGMIDSAEVQSGLYGSIKFNIIKNHKYCVINHSKEQSVADLKTVFDGVAIDRLAELRQSQTWEFIASGNASHFEVYFGDGKSYVTIQEIPISNQSVFKQLKIISDKQVADEETIYDVLTNKVDRQRGVNLYNCKTATDGAFFYDSNSNGLLEYRDGYGISDYIPVSGDCFINAPLPAGMGHNIYDKDKKRVRTISTQQYTYEQGDCYIRVTFRAANKYSLQVEYGTYATPVTAYTDECNITERFGGNNPYIFYKDEDFTSTVHRTGDGAIMRHRGFDIPRGNTGNATMIQFSVRKLDANVRAEFWCNTNIPASLFSSVDGIGVATQMGKGLIKVTLTPDLITRPDIDAFLIFYGNKDTEDWYLRLSCIKIYPLTDEASAKYAAVYSKNVTPIIYDVFKGFDSTTNDFGVTRFNSIDDANKSIRKGGILRIMPGEYNFAEMYPIASSGEGKYLGISTKGGVTYESFDINFPECTKIVWDGHFGLSDDVMLTAAQAMDRAPFHVNTIWEKCEQPTIIRGFYISCANIRYCIHPESSKYGNKKSWIISDCILEWNGSDKVDGFNGRNLGIGISCGENGLVERVVFCGTDNKGLGGHNNGFALNQTNGVAPMLKAGARLEVRRCDLGGGNIYMTTFQHDNTTPDSLIIDSCSNVARAYLGYEGDATGKQEWKGHVVNSEITDNQIEE